MISESCTAVKPVVQIQMPGYETIDHSLAKVDGQWRHGIELKGSDQAWLIVGNGTRLRLYRREGAIARPTSARGELSSILNYIDAHDAFVGATAN